MFEDSFGSSKQRKVYMQELNAPDVQLYVGDRLRSHKNFSKLAGKYANEIVSEIV